MRSASNSVLVQARPATRRPSRRLIARASAGLLLIGVVAAPAGAAEKSSADAAPDGNAVEVVSVASNGTQGDGWSFYPSISADGRYVAFTSIAGNLAPGGSNGYNQVFLRDRLRGTTVRVSSTPNGAPGNGDSAFQSISADGRYVAFISTATDLVPGGAPPGGVLLHDALRGTTSQIVSTDTGWATLSADGRYLAFSTPVAVVPGDTNNAFDVFLLYLRTGDVRRVSVSSAGVQGDLGSGGAPLAISADGRRVAFVSAATNLAPGGRSGVYVHDHTTGETVRASVPNASALRLGDGETVAISPDGRFVAFSSRDRLIYADRNDNNDVYLRDLDRGRTERISVATSGAEANGYSFLPSVSAWGRYVSFATGATNLGPPDANHSGDVYLRDRYAGTTSLLSATPAGTPGNESTDLSRLTPGAGHVALVSLATDLVRGGTNGQMQVLLRTLPGHDGITAVLRGTSVVPGPGAADGLGLALLRLYPAAGRVCAEVSTSAPGTVTSAAIRAGGPGATGPVVVDLTGLVQRGPGCISGLDPAVLTVVSDNLAQHYMEIRTTQHRAGAVRGALLR